MKCVNKCEMLTLRDALCDVGKIYIILQQIYLGNYIPNFIRIDHLHSFVHTYIHLFESGNLAHIQ